MNTGESTRFMMEFIRDFIDGKMARFEFELDYDGYIIEHFPQMEGENPVFAEIFAATVDSAVDIARRRGLSDELFRECLAVPYADCHSQALCSRF